MVKQDLELARRAVACEGWRWMPGMLAKNVTAGARVLGGKGDRPVLSAIHHGVGFMLHHLNRWPCDSFPQSRTAYPYLPDLTDPATRGALLSLVREVWDDPTAHAVPNGGLDGGWQVCGKDYAAGYVYGSGATETEALVVALEVF